ncbi:hypothetical protein WICPIJ_007527 [Wickerhamomyces pijperi]|uniref:Uncharacterized protein n=1 Tax=Wickerhamomyces pijperi TaxID=599730 RepID=A0A9P8Q289_WICPI|nr:hypothetical protein WICPIJ_007527 [Wickerhamomyces pijperi]
MADLEAWFWLASFNFKMSNLIGGRSLDCLVLVYLEVCLKRFARALTSPDSNWESSSSVKTPASLSEPSSSTSSSSYESAHSGLGYIFSNCDLSLLMYCLPPMTESVSA